MRTGDRWRTAVAADPVARRLRADARHALAAGGTWPVAALVDHLRPAWGDSLPPDDWLVALLGEDPLLHRLPDGTWLHLGAAVWGRIFTTPRSSAPSGAGLLGGGGDLDVALSVVTGWRRVPVHGPCGRGVAVRPPGTALLVVPGALLPGAGPLVAAVPGPEGVGLWPASVDEVGTTRHEQAVRRSLAAHRGCWPAADVELAVLARDAALRDSPTAPSRVLWARLGVTRSGGRRTGHG